MKIGTSEEQRQDLLGNQSVMEDKHELIEGNNLYRLIQGPRLQKAIFLPIIVESDNKELKQSFAVFNFKDSGGILDSLYQSELAIRREMGEEKPDYVFKPTENWIYLGINLMDRTGLKVKPLKVPKKVKKAIVGLEVELDLKDPEYLMNGFYWMYDLNIAKSVDKAKGVRFGTDYNVAIYGNNPFQAKVPAEWMNAPASEIIKEIGQEKIFTPEVLAAIDECTIDLDEVLKPMSESEIQEKLYKFPLDFSAINKQTGRTRYPQSKTMIEVFNSLGIKYSTLEEKPISSPVKTNVSGGLQFGKKQEAPAPITPPAPVEEPPVEQTPAPTPALVEQSQTLPGGKLKLRNLKQGGTW